MELLDSIYLGTAIVGGVFFLVRTIMQFFGSDAAMGNIDVMEGDVLDIDTDSSFTILSFHGLTVFLMMFGLFGLASLRQSPLPVWSTVLVATLAGVVSILIIAQIFRFFYSLRSSGTLDIKNALHQQGRVYLNIPTDGTGQVQLAIQNHLRICDAISQSGESLDTGTRIRVVKVLEENLLSVEKLSLKN